MLTYQVRPRVFRLADNRRPEFPAEVEVSPYLQPLQPFGMAAGGGLTAVRAIPASIQFNANTGQHFITSETPLMPLDLVIEEPVRLVSLKGNCLTVKEHCQSYEKLIQLVESLYFGVPLLLAVEFKDPLVVERVAGRIGSVPFRWELSDWQAQFDLTPQEHQEQKVATAWNRFNILSAPHRRRLMAALQYFHVACRLKREAKTPGEFLAEALLNFCKVLEVLYGPHRDQVRRSLAELGDHSEAIERDFIPVMLLRNSMDVGHPALALFTSRQLETLHRYADRAEHVFRIFLQKVFEAIESGSTDIAPYETQSVDTETKRTIERLRQCIDQLGNKP